MIKSFKNNLKYLEIPDITNQLFLLLLALISFISIENTSVKFIVLFVNLILCILIIYVVSHYEKKSYEEKRQRSFTRFLRYWYPVFTIIFCFKEIYLIMINLNHGLYDNYLIKIDLWIFGQNPTAFLSSYLNPYAVEFLQIVYGLFYLMPAIYALELYLWHRYDELKYAIFVVLLGFYISFIGYVIFPAIGPRFTLHDFHLTDTELPGIFLAEKIRSFINFVESIPDNVPNPQDYAQRDAFPSGHTIIILLITYLSRKIKSNSFYFYLPYSILMLFSTLYLRYHYFIDLAAGIPVVLITIFIANKLYGDKINFGKSPSV